MNIRIVREAGGIGDVVRCTVVARGLREKYPKATIWAYIPKGYYDLYAAVKCIDRFVFVNISNRRRRDHALDATKFPYLNPPEGIDKFDLDVDLFDPAFRYELRHGRAVLKDRIQLWCEAANVRPISYTPYLYIDRAVLKKARTVLNSAFRNPHSPIMAVQPFSTDPARDWPVRKWMRLADALQWAGFTVIILDGGPGRTNRFKQPKIVGQPCVVVAGILKLCDLVIGPDSGLNHLAAAVGTPGLGLFASQDPNVTYRWYPTHSHVTPDRDSGFSCWPCHWKRPKECLRAVLKKEGRTCPALATITVERVFDEVLSKLGRRKRCSGKSSPPCV